MAPFIDSYGPFILATSLGLFIAFLTWWAARKSGLNPAQTSLIDTLQDNAAALNDKVHLLEQKLDAERTERQRLEREVVRLKTAMVDIVAENADLRRRLGMPHGRDILDQLEDIS